MYLSALMQALTMALYSSLVTRRPRVWGRTMGLGAAGSLSFLAMETG